MKLRGQAPKYFVLEPPLVIFVTFPRFIGFYFADVKNVVRIDLTKGDEHLACTAVCSITMHSLPAPA